MAGNSNQAIILGDSDVPYPLRMGNNYVATTLNAASGVTPVNLITGNPGYFITQFGFQADVTCTTTAGGMLSITLADSSFGSFAVFRLFVPSAVTLPTVPTAIRQVNEGPIIWTNKVANSIASIAQNTALTAGSSRVFCRFGTTNYLG
jgi:hypothetical protein